MNQPNPDDETLPPDSDSPDPNGAGEPVEAGLRAIFETSVSRGAAASDQAPPVSIVERLAPRAGGVSRVHLRNVHDDTMAVRTSAGETRREAVPAQVGRYRVAGEIARGGVGAVYRAHDIDLGRDVALKVLLDGHERNPDMVRRFVEEAQIGGQLQHPGICSIHEMGLLGGDRPFFAMKLVRGRTLGALLAERSHPRDERQRFVGIFEQIAQTLAYAHARGVIHRDLKPSNVMVGAFGEVQVMDWGLAKVLTEGGAADDRPDETARGRSTVIRTLRSSGSGSESLAGSVMGTPAYMPPEQARGDVAELDERSDVFGLGAILCEILTGRPPYVGDDAESVYRLARDGALSSALARIDACDFDEHLIRLTRACLATDPADRPRHAGEVANSISAYLASVEERARSSEIRAARARTRLGWAASVFVLLAFVGTGLTWFQIDRSERRTQSELSLREALSLAQRRHDEARERGRNDPGAWQATRAAIHSARLQLESAVEPEIDFAEEIDRLDLETELLARFDEFFSSANFHPRDSYSKADLLRADAGYAEWLGKYLGFDPLTSDVREAAESARGKALASKIAEGLEHWAFVRRALDRSWRRPLEIAVEIDALRAPSRSSLRAAVLDRRRFSNEEILELVRASEGSGHVHLVDVLFQRPEDGEVLERALRTIVERNPSSYHARIALGQQILQAPEPDVDNAIRHLEAARAISRGHSAPLYVIAEALLLAGRLDEALREWMSAVSLKPLKAPPYRRLIRLLEKPETLSLDSLDFVIDRSRRIHAEHGEIEPLVREVLALATAGRALKSEDLPAAIRALEEIPVTTPGPSLTQEHARLLEKCRKRVLPDLASYRSIDAEFEPRVRLLPRDAEWKIYHEEDAPPSDWMGVSFDDTPWASAGFPIGFRRAYSPHAVTILEGVVDHRTERSTVPSIYLRSTFAVDDLKEYDLVELQLRCTGAFVVYVNGVRVGSRGIVESDGPAQHHAISLLDAQPPNLRTMELPLERFREGKNSIGVHVILTNRPSPDLELVAFVEARLLPERARVERQRLLEALRATPDSPGKGARVDYFEARQREKEGELDAAIAIYRRIVNRDDRATEPFERLASCLLSISRDAETARQFDRLIAKALHPSVDLWNRWIQLSLVDAGRTPRQLLLGLPDSARKPRYQSNGIPTSSATYPDDLRWLLDSIDRDRAFRINCGGGDLVDSKGKDWSRDRFFVAGSLHHSDLEETNVHVEGTADSPLYLTNRWFFHGDFVGYRIPLPPGRYAVTLHSAEVYFAAPDRRAFDIEIESRPAVTQLDLARDVGRMHAWQFRDEFDITDGMLDIEFVHRIENPMIAGIEIEAVD